MSMNILSVDLLIFSVLIMIYLRIKHKWPDVFFPPSGVSVFLPPEEQDIKELRREKENSQKNLNKYQKQKFSGVITLIIFH